MSRGRLFLIIAIVCSLVKNCQARDGTACSVSITRVNFENYIEVLNGTNRTLSCKIHSDTPLKEEPIWRKDDLRLSTDIKYIVENASCSNSTSQTCIVSNLTLINAVRFEYKNPYVGNYSLTAENDCGTAVVNVFVDIIIPPTCEDDYNKPPQFKTPPPSIVEAVEGHSVTIRAQYEGNKDDRNLGVYWCVYKTPDDYYCYSLNETDNYNVSIDGCPPGNGSCCYFTVLLKIKSVTCNLTLQSMVVWQQHPKNFIPGSSILVANVYPTLDKRIPNTNKCVELTEGQSTEFTCIYKASTNPNVTTTTWKFNEVLLEHDSSQYTMTTLYDPVNFNHVLSRITFSNVRHDNTGTYTCQCSYNSKVINEKDVVSEAADFYLEVKPGTSKSFPLLYIILIVIGVIMLIALLVSVVVMIVVLCWWKRQKNKNCDKNSELRAKPFSEETPLLQEGDREKREKQMENVVANNPLINDEQFENDRKRSPSGSLSDDTSSTDHAEDKPKRQDSHSSIPDLTPNHQESHHHLGDMVAEDIVAAEVHDQLPTHSTSLESFKIPSGNGHVDQPVTSNQDVQDGSNKASGTKKPTISVLPTEKPIECDAEGPQIPHPAAVRPPGSELVLPRPLNQATNNVSSVDTEKNTAEASTGCHNKILNSIAPEFNHINMVSLLPHLQQHGLVTEDEEHHLIIEAHSSVKKAQLLLSYLKTKGDESLQKILCCLNLAHEHSGHKGIADKLKQMMEVNNIECADLCAEHSE